MRIAENAQFVAAREAELRHDGDDGYIMMIIESLHARGHGDACGGRPVALATVMLRPASSDGDHSTMV